MRSLFYSIALLAALSLHASAQPSRPRVAADSLRIVWSDVDHFWQAYDRLATARTTADSLAIIDTHYLALATPGLRKYAEAAQATASDWLRAIRTHRRYLTAIRPAMQSVGQQQMAIQRAARQLRAIYPAAKFPALYFAVGKFEVGGTAFGDALYIGAELKCASAQPPLAEIRPELRGSVSAVSTVSTACIHEIIHGQQQLLDCRTNLEGALKEGAAEYLAFRLTGRLGAPAAFAYAKQHEAAVRRRFAEQADQPIAAQWFVSAPDATTGEPGALGYVVGFRICEAYYAQAPDKKQALRQLVTLENVSQLLAAGRRYLALP